MAMIGAFLAFYSSLGGGGIGELLFQWEQAGVFTYLLPFLLIFALIFGILSTMSLFGDDSKGINAVIAIAVSLMSLQFNFVSVFFSELFPRFGIALSIILVFLVLLGLFVGNKDGKLNKGFKWFMFIIVLIVVAVVLINSFEAYGWYTGFGIGYWLNYNWGTLLVILLFFGALIGIIVGSNKKNPKKGLKIISED